MHKPVALSAFSCRFVCTIPHIVFATYTITFELESSYAVHEFESEWWLGVQAKLTEKNSDNVFFCDFLVLHLFYHIIFQDPGGPTFSIAYSYSYQ